MTRVWVAEADRSVAGFLTMMLASADPVEHRKGDAEFRRIYKLKNWRRVATRYDKTTSSHLGFVTLASVKLWLPFDHER